MKELKCVVVKENGRVFMEYRGFDAADLREDGSRVASLIGGEWWIEPVTESTEEVVA